MEKVNISAASFFRLQLLILTPTTLRLINFIVVQIAITPIPQEF